MFFDKISVYVNGKMAKVVGKICMDQCMIDLSHIEDAKLGDEVIIFGEGAGVPSAEDVASALGTINYEIVCMVGRRVPRVYLSKGEIVDYVDYLL